MEKTPLENRIVSKGYNFKAFLFSFIYYFYMRLWWFGITAFILTVILPFQLYFAISFVESYILWKRNEIGLSYGSKWKKYGIATSCLSVLLCVVLKGWLYMLLSNI